MKKIPPPRHTSPTPSAAPRSLREPAPLWPDAPRYCPDWKLPSYRFVAGLNPHPTRDPRGHSYGREEAEVEHLSPERWRENRLFLRGIDLYHHGYFWEAHEVWEQLWKLVDRHSSEGQFLQGLILLSAARIKHNARSAAGVRKTSWLAYRRLQAAREKAPCDAQGRFMGLDLPDLLAQVKRHYAPLWPDGSLRGIVLRGDPPRLLLEQ